MTPTDTPPDTLAQSFFEQHPHAALVFDASGRVVHANSAAFWVAPDGEYPTFAQLTGLPWPQDASGPGAAGAGWSRRLRVQAFDRTTRHVDASLFLLQPVDSTASRHCLVLRDITASVQAALGGHEIEGRSKVTTDTAPVLIWMARPDMMRDWFNKSWLTFRGRTLGDELGKGWTEGVHAEDLERCLGTHASSSEERQPYSMDYRLLRHDGVYRWVLDTGIPRWAQDGSFLGYIGSCLDITDRKAIEDQLAEHTRTLRLADRRREDFLAKLSHELRNPLGPIANAAAILRTMESGNRNLVMVREIIERQVDQLRRLVTDLVDVTRITKGTIVLQRERIEIQTLIESALDVVRPEIDRRHQILRVVWPPTGLACEGDAQRLMQALSAMLSNASKFSPPGSTILVSTRASSAILEITFKDPGRGIAPELLPRIFDVFVQGEQSLARDDGGLGVGLTVARRVAELHGGNVEVTSAGSGLGTEAILRLPLRVPVTGARADSFDPTTITGRRVLIIEDNPDARESLRVLMELGGNDVLTAGNAAQGLHIAETFAPDLVVCDIGLPDVDGCELVQQLRQKLAGLPTSFVALTGYGRPEDRDRAMESGFDTFMVKPLAPAQSGVGDTPPRRDSRA